MMSFLRNSLFVKIYLTLIAALAIVAVVSGLFIRMGQDEQDRGWRGRRDAFILAMLPPQAPAAEHQLVIDRLSRALEADIALFDRDGRLIAEAGDKLPPGILDRRKGRDERDIFVLRLDDGRFVAARMAFMPGPGRRNPLVWMALIAASTGLVAYPVVRHLTRRLERLGAGVKRWGSGDLSSRVSMQGTDEVASVATEFDRAAERVERMIAAHRALLANASHELRSPLARLRMAIDLVEGAPDERTRAEIIRNLGELDALVDEILLASRLDHTGPPERLEPVELLALAAEECARNAVAVTGTPAILAGDARLLTRLVRNLIQNALRHGAPPLEVKVIQRDRQVELSVRDHGPGIPPGDVANVFEPFYRPAGRSEAAGGWGLGLALVRQIAIHHGGTVVIETPPDGGARFVVSLPALPASGREPA